MPNGLRSKIANLADPTPDEAKSALMGYTAYFGTFAVDERSGTVVHHTLGSIKYQNAPVDLIRKFEFGIDGKITLIPTVGGGPMPEVGTSEVISHASRLL